nr:immunoglobulin light chain junction region [Macaca mulatta]MOY07545.1 immunoglobulin light chain junction region [Macaca mulatta]
DYYCSSYGGRNTWVF